MEHTRDILLGKSLAELKVIAGELGLPGFTAKQIMQWIYEKGVSDIEDMTHGGQKPNWREPLMLRLGDGRLFRLEFDCKHCQMNVYACQG